MIKERKTPAMTFTKIEKIYQTKKQHQKKGDFSFVADIFEEIHDRYIKKTKKLKKDANQSWNAWSGKNFQKLITYIIADFIKTSDWNVEVTDDDTLRRNSLTEDLDKVRRNICIFYERYAIVPDADIIIYDKNNFKVIAVLSCKASLRERIAQAAYWKIKLQSVEVTRHILCYLISSDKDSDFKNSGVNISRNRIIVEFGELDGAYILRDIPESTKIKHFNKIFTDLNDIFVHWFNKSKR